MEMQELLNKFLTTDEVNLWNKIQIVKEIVGTEVTKKTVDYGVKLTIYAENLMRKQMSELVGIEEFDTLKYSIEVLEGMKTIPGYKEFELASIEEYRKFNIDYMEVLSLTIKIMNITEGM